MTYHIRHRARPWIGHGSDRALWDVLTETGELVSTHRTNADAEHKRAALNAQPVGARCNAPDPATGDQP